MATNSMATNSMATNSIAGYASSVMKWLGTQSNTKIVASYSVRSA